MFPATPIKISVLIPVYNTAKYLRICLGSLKRQTLGNIEFILVDDGSTDESGKICDEIADNDSRFRVIHQKNGGLAVARQTGLDNAKGEYIIVCDSDDWVEENMYELLYKKAIETDTDIVVCGYYAEYGDGKSIPKQTWFKEKDGFVDNGDFLRRGAGSSWIKLVKKSLFERTEASYVSGINMGEDALIFYKLMKGNPKVCQIDANLYHYRRLPSGGSYTNNVKMSHIYQLDFTYRWLKENYCNPEYESIRYSRALNIAFACLRTKDTDKEFLYSFLRTELGWERIFSNKISLKASMIIMEKLLPYKLSKLILRTIYPLVYK